MEYDVIGYVLDALEPEELEAFEAALATNTELQQKVEATRRRVQPLAEDDFIEAPPDLAATTFEAIRATSFVASLRDTVEAPVDQPASRVRLLDVCVALSVLLLMGTLIMPALMLIRGDQQRIVCADNLRNLGTALGSYADFEASYLPYVAQEGVGSHAGVYAMSLKARDLLPEPSSLICPAANSAVVLVPDWDRYLASAAQPSRQKLYQETMGGSYGYSLGYVERGEYHGLRRDKLADNRAIASDRPARAYESEFVNSPNHEDRGQNVLFADGTVRWLSHPTFARDNLFINNLSKAAAGLADRDTVIRVSEEPGTVLGTQEL